MTGNDTTRRGLVEGLRERHDYFAKRGAKASDHGLLEPYGLEVMEKRAKEIFHDAYEGKVKFGIRSRAAALRVSTG